MKRLKSASDRSGGALRVSDSPRLSYETCNVVRLYHDVARPAQAGCAQVEATQSKSTMDALSLPERVPEGLRQACRLLDKTSTWESAAQGYAQLITIVRRSDYVSDHAQALVQAGFVTMLVQAVSLDSPNPCMHTQEPQLPEPQQSEPQQPEPATTDSQGGESPPVQTSGMGVMVTHTSSDGVQHQLTAREAARAGALQLISEIAGGPKSHTAHWPVLLEAGMLQSLCSLMAQAAGSNQQAGGQQEQASDSHPFHGVPPAVVQAATKAVWYTLVDMDGYVFVPVQERCLQAIDLHLLDSALQLLQLSPLPAAQPQQPGQPKSTSPSASIATNIIKGLCMLSQQPAAAQAALGIPQALSQAVQTLATQLGTQQSDAATVACAGLGTLLEASRPKAYQGAPALTLLQQAGALQLLLAVIHMDAVAVSNLIFDILSSRSECDQECCEDLCRGLVQAIDSDPHPIQSPELAVMVTHTSSDGVQHQLTAREAARARALQLICKLAWDQKAHPALWPVLLEAGMLQSLCSLMAQAAGSNQQAGGQQEQASDSHPFHGVPPAVVQAATEAVWYTLVDMNGYVFVPVQERCQQATDLHLLDSALQLLQLSPLPAAQPQQPGQPKSTSPSASIATNIIKGLCMLSQQPAAAQAALGIPQALSQAVQTLATQLGTHQPNAATVAWAGLKTLTEAKGDYRYKGVPVFTLLQQAGVLQMLPQVIHVDAVAVSNMIFDILSSTAEDDQVYQEELCRALAQAIVSDPHPVQSPDMDVMVKHTSSDGVQHQLTAREAARAGALRLICKLAWEPKAHTVLWPALFKAGMLEYLCSLMAQAAGSNQQAGMPQQQASDGNPFHGVTPALMQAATEAVWYMLLDVSFVASEYGYEPVQTPCQERCQQATDLHLFSSALQLLQLRPLPAAQPQQPGKPNQGSPSASIASNIIKGLCMLSQQPAAAQAALGIPQALSQAVQTLATQLGRHQSDVATVAWAGLKTLTEVTQANAYQGTPALTLLQQAGILQVLPQVTHVDAVAVSKLMYNILSTTSEGDQKCREELCRALVQAIASDPHPVQSAGMDVMVTHTRSDGVQHQLTAREAARAGALQLICEHTLKVARDPASHTALWPALLKAGVLEYLCSVMAQAAGSNQQAGMQQQQAPGSPPFHGVPTAVVQTATEGVWYLLLKREDKVFVPVETHCQQAIDLHLMDSALQLLQLNPLPAAQPQQPGKPNPTSPSASIASNIIKGLCLLSQQPAAAQAALGIPQALSQAVQALAAQLGTHQPDVAIVAWAGMKTLLEASGAEAYQGATALTLLQIQLAADQSNAAQVADKLRSMEPAVLEPDSGYTQWYLKQLYSMSIEVDKQQRAAGPQAKPGSGGSSSSSSSSSSWPDLLAGVLHHVADILAQMVESSLIRADQAVAVSAHKLFMAITDLRGRQGQLPSYFALDAMFHGSLMTNMLKVVEQHMDDENFTFTCSLELFRNIASDSLKYHQRLRQLGVIPVAIKAMARHPTHTDRVAVVFNMSRTAAVHNTLREAKMLDALEGVISGGQEKFVFQALVAIAHVYSGSDSPEDARATQLLTDHDASAYVIQVMEQACKTGTGSADGTSYGLDLLAHCAYSLSRTTEQAGNLVDCGLVAMLVTALGNEHGRKPECASYIAETLLNMAHAKDLRRQLKKAGVVAALQPYASSDDVKVSDPARGCLLLLGELQDQTAQAAMQQSQIQPGAAADGSAKVVKYEVFLSHKRSDAKDFARALYNLLVLRGISTFLDFEYREELNQLGDIVGQCQNLVFILSDNIFDSEWCMKELQAAVKHKTNIILVTKDGARWRDESGNLTCPFPPDSLLKTLPPEVREVCTRKSIAHNDEYYQAFVDTFLSKVQRYTPQQAQAAATAAATSSAMVPAVQQGMQLAPVHMHGRAPDTAGMQEIMQLKLQLAELKAGFVQSTTLQSAPGELLQQVDALQRSVASGQQASGDQLQTLRSLAVAQQEAQRAHALLLADQMAAMQRQQADHQRLQAEQLATLQRQQSDHQRQQAEQLAALQRQLAEHQQLVSQDMRQQLRTIGNEHQDLRRSLGQMTSDMSTLQSMLLTIMRGVAPFQQLLQQQQQSTLAGHNSYGQELSQTAPPMVFHSVPMATQPAQQPGMTSLTGDRSTTSTGLDGGTQLPLLNQHQQGPGSKARQQGNRPHVAGFQVRPKPQ